MCISCCQSVIATKRSCCQATYLKTYGQPYQLPRDTWYKLLPIAFPCLVSPGRGKPPALVHIYQAHNVVTGKFLVSGLICEVFVENLNFSIHQTTEYLTSCHFSAFVAFQLSSIFTYVSADAHAQVPISVPGVQYYRKYYPVLFDIIQYYPELSSIIVRILRGQRQINT